MFRKGERVTNLAILEAEIKVGGRLPREFGDLDTVEDTANSKPPQWFNDAFRSTQSFGIANSIMRDIGSQVDQNVVTLTGGKYASGELYTADDYSAYGSLGNDKVLKDFRDAHPEWRNSNIFSDYTVTFTAK